MLKIRYILILFLCLLLVPNVQAAMSVSYSQAGADSGTVMKGKTFTVSASDWSGSCNSAYLDFSQCPVCSITEESQTKSITGQSSVTWTTVTTTNTASAQRITVTVSGGCSGESGDTSSFDVVLPPVITINSYSPSSYSDPTGSSTINLNFRNSGETVAKDVGITLSLPSGVTTTDDESQTESTIDPDENWGTSWTVSFGSISSSTDIYIYITPSNADSKTVTIPISITPPGQQPPGEDGGGTMGGPSEEAKNASRRPELVPGVGLRNNTKLQAALEKVLAKGKLSENAINNLIRLSNSIASDVEVTRDFKAEGGESELSMRMRYRGQRRVQNFIVHDKIPKTFASTSDNVTVTAAGAKVEIVEKDPEYVFLYTGIDPDQEIVITYSVDEEVAASVINETETSVYGESYEGLPPGEVCIAGEKRCEGNDLQECNEDRTGWTTLETCEYGCDPAKLTCKATPKEEITPIMIDLENVMWIVAAIVIIIVVVLGGIFIKKRKKKSVFKAPRPMPEMKPPPSTL